MSAETMTLNLKAVNNLTSPTKNISKNNKNDNAERSLAKEKSVEPIFSTIINFKEKDDFAFLVLQGADSAFQLTFERSKKNNTPILISLYKNNIYFSNQLIYHRFDYILANLSTGDYELRYNDILAFRFKIRIY